MAYLTIKQRETLEGVIRSAKVGAPYTLTFSPKGSMTAEEAAQLEAHLKERFELWAASWIVRPIENVLKEVH